jgi:hypothetical protein
MARKKGALKEIAATLGEVLQTVGAEVGLVSEPKPKTKSARKAAKKAIVQQVKEGEKLTKAAKRTAHRRVVGLDAVEVAGSDTAQL